VRTSGSRGTVVFEVHAYNRVRALIMGNNSVNQ
jgi:hypothetical protein